MKKFLCAVDSSPAANNAVEYAARLASHFDAELILLQILEYSTMQDMANLGGGFPPDTKEREQIAEKRLTIYCNEVEKEFSVRCRSLVKTYTTNVKNALKKEIENDSYDLIIMGTNGGEDLNQFFFGTHAYNVMRKTICPLLMIPEECSFKQYKHVVYASNYESEDVRSLRKLLTFTKVFSPELTVLHVSEKPTAVSQEVFRSFKQIIEDLLDSPEIHFQRIVEEDASSGIDLYLKRHNADLLVLLTKQHSFVERIFNHSITRKLSFIASYPVLIYHG